MPGPRTTAFGLRRFNEARPYQVAIYNDLCLGHSFVLIQRFLSEQKLDCETASVYAVWPIGGRVEMRLHCFRDRPSAELFQARFGGDMFDPVKDRERGHPKGVWRRYDHWEVPLDQGDLHVPEKLRS
jgi:hypothetical protein